jgi:hypothetical protein
MFRLQALMPIAMGPKYDKYRNDEAGTMHIALLSAIAYAPCSPRMTPKVLRASLDKAFREILPQVEALDTKGAGGSSRTAGASCAKTCFGASRRLGKALATARTSGA